MNSLQRLAEIRKQIESLKAEAEAIEPDAIISAFEIAKSELSPNGKNVVFSDANAKIVLVIRNRYDDKNVSVMRLDEDIDREYEKLCKSAIKETESLRSYITELSQLIEEAELKCQELVTSPYLERLRKQRAIALKATEHKVPNLAVYVK